MSALDWPGLLRAGLRDLRLSPVEFWRLTPVELKIMLGAEGSAAILTRDRLEELALAYPDARRTEADDGHCGSDGPDRRP